MFANPIWSFLLLASPFAVYFLIIRPRLKASLPEVFENIDGRWAKVWAFLKRFQTLVVYAAGALLLAAPDILVTVAPVDFSDVLPRPWAAYVGPGCMALNFLLKALSTTPATQPPSQG
jgi:hypothetical protein